MKRRLTQDLLSGSSQKGKAITRQEMGMSHLSENSVLRKPFQNLHIPLAAHLGSRLTDVRPYAIMTPQMLAMIRMIPFWMVASLVGCGKKIRLGKEL